MTDANTTDDAILDIVAALDEYFGHITGARTLSIDVRLLYVTQLRAFPLDDVRHVANVLMCSNRRMPAIADFLDQLRGSANDDAILAWAQFIAAVRRVGSSSSVWIENGCLAQALARVFGDGSWATPALTMIEADEGMRAHYKKSFVEYYRIGQKERSQQHAYLVGEHERHNASQQFEVPPFAPTFTVWVGVIPLTGEPFQVRRAYSRQTARLVEPITACPERPRLLARWSDAPALPAGEPMIEIGTTTFTERLQSLLVAHAMPAPSAPVVPVSSDARRERLAQLEEQKRLLLADATQVDKQRRPLRVVRKVKAGGDIA